MQGDITPLKYRVFRANAPLVAATFPDEGQHNQTIIRMLRNVHQLAQGDVVVFDLGSGASGKMCSIAYEVEARCVTAIRLPEYARMA